MNTPGHEFTCMKEISMSPLTIITHLRSTLFNKRKKPASPVWPSSKRSLLTPPSKAKSTPSPATKKSFESHPQSRQCWYQCPQDLPLTTHASTSSSESSKTTTRFSLSTSKPPSKPSPPPNISNSDILRKINKNTTTIQVTSHQKNTKSPNPDRQQHVWHRHPRPCLCLQTQVQAKAPYHHWPRRQNFQPIKNNLTERSIS